MYYFKMLLRLTTIVFPIYVICAIIALCISFQGGDLSHWPYAFHPLFEIVKSSSDHSNDVYTTNMIIIGNIVVCSFLAKSFTANIQYENLFVEFIGGPLAIFFLISWFNPSLYEIASIPGELVGLYLSLCLAINIVLLLLGKKLMGIPGLKFGSGLISGYNKQVERTVESNNNNAVVNETPKVEKTTTEEEKIIKVTEFAGNVNIITNKGSGRSYRGNIINWTDTSITVHDEVTGWVSTYNAKGHKINSYPKK